MASKLTKAKLDRRGSVAVEFSLIVPVLLIFVAGIVDFGRAFYFRTELDQSLRSGMQYALKAPDDFSGIASVVAQSSPMPMTVLFPTASCRCYEDAPASCTSICPTGHMRSYVTLSASYSYTPIFPGTMFGLLPSSPLLATLIVRTQ